MMKGEVSDIMGCALCPRRCGAERANTQGFCGGGSRVRAARAALHFWEEPCISGTAGSGAVFFSGCPLKCVFCQNADISAGNFGRELTVPQLADVFRRLEKQGAHNLNLVTPTHYTPQVLEALALAAPAVPVVMNCGGYEEVDTLARWAGRVDVYLPDLKYFDPGLSARYSAAPDYFERASAAILEMHRQRPAPVFGADGLLKSGLIVRHLVLPGASRDSLRLLQWLRDALPQGSFLLSLMRQFTPTAGCKSYPELDRRLTTFEYRRVADRAAELGFQGFTQGRDSAQSVYTPDFDLTGLT